MKPSEPLASANINCFHAPGVEVIRRDNGGVGGAVYAVRIGGDTVTEYGKVMHQDYPWMEIADNEENIMRDLEKYTL